MFERQLVLSILLFSPHLRRVPTLLSERAIEVHQVHDEYHVHGDDLIWSRILQRKNVECCCMRISVNVIRLFVRKHWHGFCAKLLCD